jgi:hypothetical protein
MRTILITALSSLAVLAACQHERPSDPATPRVAQAPRPEPRARPMAARVPDPTDAECARIAADLRAKPLTERVRGSVVVLDGDAGTVRTTCGADAIAAAESLGVAILDPRLSAPSCQAQGDRIVCEQAGEHAGDPRVELYFERAGGWSLTGAVLGRVDRPLRSSAIDRFGIRLEHAQCSNE